MSYSIHSNLVDELKLVRGVFQSDHQNRVQRVMGLSLFGVAVAGWCLWLVLIIGVRIQQQDTVGILLGSGLLCGSLLLGGLFVWAAIQTFQKRRVEVTRDKLQFWHGDKKTETIALSTVEKVHLKPGTRSCWLTLSGSSWEKEVLVPRTLVDAMIEIVKS